MGSISLRLPITVDVIKWAGNVGKGEGLRVYRFKRGTTGVIVSVRSTTLKPSRVMPLWI